MKVLVTGAAGFIGSHVIDALLARGHQVVGLDDLSTGSLENLNAIGTHPLFTFEKGDIRDAKLVDRLIGASDAVVHLAARVGLKMVVERPLDTIQVNARGTEVVLDAAAEHGTAAIVASTSEVYGLATKFPSSEADPICYGSPTVDRWSYACAKAYDEFYALALHRERKLPAVVVRLFNTVGPRQTGRYGMVIPRFVTQALAGEPLTVYGDGDQTRCFCYVGDVVAAFVTLVENTRAHAGEVFNLGNPMELSVLELAKKVIALTNSASSIRLVPFDEAYPSGFEEIMRRVPDVTKAKARLGFDPKTPLEAILEAVIASVRAKELVV